MIGIKKRIVDALFLWENARKESAFLLVLIAISGLSKLRYPCKEKGKDGENFMKLLEDFTSNRIRVEYDNKLLSVEYVFYKLVRNNLVHESKMPDKVVFQEDENINSMSIRAGGSPEYFLKLWTGWFFHFVKAVIQSNELNK